MDEVKEGRQRKLIKWVIFVLAIIAIGLAIAIAVIAITGNKDPKGSDTPDGDNKTIVIEDDETFQDNDPSPLHQYLAEDLERISAQADELLNKDPDNAETVRMLYLEKIKECIKEEAEDLVNVYSREGANKLISKGFKKDALNYLLSVNLNYISGLEKCATLFEIVSLARDLGEDQVLEEYEQLLNNTDDSFGIMCIDSEDSKIMYENDVKEREGL